MVSAASGLGELLERRKPDRERIAKPKQVEARSQFLLEVTISLLPIAAELEQSPILFSWLVHFCFTFSIGLQARFFYSVFCFFAYPPEVTCLSLPCLLRTHSLSSRAVVTFHH